MSKTITVIPATINPITRLPNLTQQKRRTSGYARVSTDKDEQFTSYEAQVDYYTKYIKNNPDWEFAGVYTDEGITGTNTKRRDGFKQMIEDAIAGKIDLIVTKSVSRFARNTVDSLVTIRKLREIGVEVFFEKENIWTLDSKGELLLTIMSSLAQEESRSISENVTWAKRKNAADGKVTLGFSQFLGYDRGTNGQLVVNKEQAEVVKRIYREFMAGKTPGRIATELKWAGILTPAGKNCNWQRSTVVSILKNEKYKGAALLQKTFTVDFLTKKSKINEGEVPQYYVENNHEPIIPPDEWDVVQKEMTRRKAMGRSYNGNSIFAARLVCEDCGAFYGSKVWNSTSEKYRKIIWQCNNKFKGDKKCGTPHITEQQIKEKFVEAFNRLFQNKDEIIANCETIARELTDCTELDMKLEDLKQELEVVIKTLENGIKQNATKAMNQEEYLHWYEKYSGRYEELVGKIKSLEHDREQKQIRHKQFEKFIAAFKSTPNALIEFDEQLWTTTIDKVRINHNGTCKFMFCNNTEITL